MSNKSDYGASPVENLIAANFKETNRRLEDVYQELKGIADALADMNERWSEETPIKINKK